MTNREAKHLLSRTPPPCSHFSPRADVKPSRNLVLFALAGRLLVHRKADGKSKTHVYGNAQRDLLTQVNYSNGEPARVMTYDPAGRLTGEWSDQTGRTIDEGEAAARRVSHEMTRMANQTQALTGGPTGSFVYDYNYATDDGNLASHTRPDGSHIDYAWNARNLLDSVTSDGPPPVADYEYNLRNQLVSTSIENNIFTATRHYDNAGRLVGITHAGIVETTGYDLSPDGRRTGITRNGDAESYGYDNARQVTSGNYGGLSTTQSWNYDPAGNRLTAVTNGSTTTYQANAVNEYFSITGGGHVPPPPTYDDNGNATTWNVLPLGSSSLASGAFTWNINNELVAASVSPLPLGEGQGEGAQYAYDALGRRIKRTETIGGVTTTTWFFYNGWNVELEHNGTANTRRHTWGLDLSGDLQGAGGVGGLLMVEHLPPLPLGEGGGEGASGLAEAYFPTYDGNGNITAWVDATGTVIARQRYDAFGNLLSQTGIAPSNYAFSTKPMERVTGLYYYGYRYYDPVTGRWINRDPIEERGGVNYYSMIINKIINEFDVLGLQPAGIPPPSNNGKVPGTFTEAQNCAGYVFGELFYQPPAGKTPQDMMLTAECKKLNGEKEKCEAGRTKVFLATWGKDSFHFGKEEPAHPGFWSHKAPGEIGGPFYIKNVRLGCFYFYGPSGKLPSIQGGNDPTFKIEYWCCKCPLDAAVKAKMKPYEFDPYTKPTP